MLRALVLLSLVFTLSSCGFAPRGALQLPAEMAFSYIDDGRPADSPPSALKLALARTLDANGVVVTATLKAAKARLLILRDDYRRRILATGQSGQVREFNLTYEVAFLVNLADGRSLIKQDTVRITRDILYDETQVLGRVAGEELAREEMIRDAARAILRRLQAQST